jgi:hypothetical protein
MGVLTRSEDWSLVLTFSAVTSSETSRRERDEMESTRGAIFGETGDAGGCSGAAEDDGREDEKARREEEARHDGREAARPSVRSRDRLEVWIGVSGCASSWDGWCNGGIRTDMAERMLLRRRVSIGGASRTTVAALR